MRTCGKLRAAQPCNPMVGVMGRGPSEQMTPAILNVLTVFLLLDAIR
jgi:hypothetical protein